MLLIATKNTKHDYASAIRLPESNIRIQTGNRSEIFHSYCGLVLYKVSSRNSIMNFSITPARDREQCIRNGISQ